MLFPQRTHICQMCYHFSRRTTNPVAVGLRYINLPKQYFQSVIITLETSKVLQVNLPTKMTMTDDIELQEPTNYCQNGAVNMMEQDGNESENSAASTEGVVNFLIRNEKIIFKSQQIDDPDLTIEEKKSIAYSILNESHSKFLSRFGQFLQNEHLKYFEKNSYEGDENYEIEFLLKELKKDLKNREQNVKNRRYAAIRKLSKESDYFSETEMMRREPHLYEQLVGQYLTETEKRTRDGFDPKNTLFSQILLNNMDKEKTEDLRKKQENDDVSDTNSQNSQKSSRTNVTSNDDLFPKTPPSYRKHWGDFTEEESNFESAKPKKKSVQKYITAGEREMLRQEFVGIMHAKFLEGKDADFDYSKIDDNPELDDLDQINQDIEDEYFNNDDDEEGFPVGVDRMEEDGGNLDDLDIYMRHLSKNLDS